MKFEVQLDVVDETLTAEQLAEAIKSRLLTLDLGYCEGTLYLEPEAVTVTPKE